MNTRRLYWIGKGLMAAFIRSPLNKRVPGCLLVALVLSAVRRTQPAISEWSHSSHSVLITVAT